MIAVIMLLFYSQLVPRRLRRLNGDYARKTQIIKHTPELNRPAHGITDTHSHTAKSNFRGNVPAYLAAHLLTLYLKYARQRFLAGIVVGQREPRHLRVVLAERVFRSE